MNASVTAAQLNEGSEWIQAQLEHIQEPESWHRSLSRNPVFIDQSDMTEMQAIIALTTEISTLPKYRKNVLNEYAWLKAAPQKAPGVLYGYDFHLSENGPRLIEINTNAGGLLFNNLLNTLQAPCCDLTRNWMRAPIPETQALKQTLIDMFRHEYATASHEPTANGTSLKRIAIVDEKPEQQFLYPEFRMFKELFEEHGIECDIVSPAELHYDGERIFSGKKTVDLIYNRLTDFYLASPELEHLRTAFLEQQVVLTPNPFHYAIAADKRILCQLSNKAFLTEMGLPLAEQEQLLKAIPETSLVTHSNAAGLWSRRKHLFFKPTRGYGSKASYSGAKLTRNTWEHIVESGDYIAQAYVPPSQRSFRHEREQKRFKVDIRNYVYQGEVIFVSSRLYRGQATNMRTAGGGFATVYSVPQ